MSEGVVKHDNSGRGRRVIALAAAAQFVVVRDLALLLPRGPALVEPLALPPASLGALLAVYAAAAAISGVVLAPMLDRFDRRRALLVALVGLSLASASGSLATGFASLLALRASVGRASETE